jgi:hypothetical protein
VITVNRRVYFNRIILFHAMMSVRRESGRHRDGLRLGLG